MNRGIQNEEITEEKTVNIEDAMKWNVRFVKFKINYTVHT